MGKEDEPEEDKPYWNRSGNKSSQTLFISFVAVIIIMLIILTSLSIVSYMKWQDLKKRPKIRANKALFEFKQTEGVDEAKIIVHLTLVNEGDEKSKNLQLEWIVMNSSDRDDKLILERETMNLSSIPESGSKRVTFNFTLFPGNYVISYRTYEDKLFSYEGKQDFSVTEEDTSEDTSGAEDEEEGAGTDTPMLPVTVFIIITIFLAIVKKVNKKSEREEER